MERFYEINIPTQRIHVQTIKMPLSAEMKNV